MRYWGVPGSAIHVAISCELASERSFQQMFYMLWYPCESHRAQPALAEDWTKLWGGHPHASPLTGPGLEAFLTHSGTVFTCLTLFGLFFWEGTLDSHDFPRHIVDPNSQDVLPSCSMILYCFTMLFFTVMSIPVLDENKISTFLQHNYILCNQSNRAVLDIVLWTMVFTGDYLI